MAAPHRTILVRRAHRLAASATALAIVVLLAACGGSSPTRVGAGDRVEVSPGEHFEVVLRENLTVGESWDVVVIDESVVTQIGSKRHRHDSDLDGSAGTSTFEFEAVADGVAEIEFEQDFRGEEIIQRMSVTVDVET